MHTFKDSVMVPQCGTMVAHSAEIVTPTTEGLEPSNFPPFEPGVGENIAGHAETLVLNFQRSSWSLLCKHFQLEKGTNF